MGIFAHDKANELSGLQRRILNQARPRLGHGELVRVPFGLQAMPGVNDDLRRPPTAARTDSLSWCRGRLTRINS